MASPFGLFGMALPDKKAVAPPPRPLSETEKEILHAHQADIYAIRMERQTAVAAKLVEVQETNKKDLNKKSISGEYFEPPDPPPASRGVLTKKESKAEAPLSVLPPLVQRKVKEGIKKQNDTKVKFLESPVLVIAEDKKISKTKSGKEKKKENINFGSGLISDEIINNNKNENNENIFKRKNNVLKLVRELEGRVENGAYRCSIASLNEREEEQLTKNEEIKSIPRSHGAFPNHMVVKCVQQTETIKQGDAILFNQNNQNNNNNNNGRRVAFDENKNCERLFMDGCSIKQPLPITLEIVNVSRMALMKEGLNLMFKMARDWPQCKKQEGEIGSRKKTLGFMLDAILLGKVSLKSIQQQDVYQLQTKINYLFFSELIILRDKFPPNVSNSCRDDLRMLAEKVEDKISELMIDVILERLKYVSSMRPSQKLIDFENEKKKQKEKENRPKRPLENTFLEDVYTCKRKSSKDEIKISNENENKLERMGSKRSHNENCRKLFSTHHHNEVIEMKPNSKSGTVRKLRVASTTRWSLSKESNVINIDKISEICDQDQQHFSESENNKYRSRTTILSSQKDQLPQTIEPLSRRKTSKEKILAAFVFFGKQKSEAEHIETINQKYSSDMTSRMLTEQSVPFPELEEINEVMNEDLDGDEKRYLGRVLLMMMGTFKFAKKKKSYFCLTDEEMAKDILKDLEMVQKNNQSWWWVVPRGAANPSGLFFEFPSMCASLRRPKNRILHTTRCAERTMEPAAVVSWDVRCLPEGGKLSSLHTQINQGGFQGLQFAVIKELAGAK